jgi:hypothetical protein
MKRRMKLSVGHRCGLIAFMTVGAVGCNRIPDNSLIQNFTKNEAAFVQLRDLFASFAADDYPQESDHELGRCLALSAAGH